MGRLKLEYLLFMLAVVQICDAYKIVVIFPLAGRSHHILGQGYVRHLLEAGHEVTYLTPFPSGKTNAMYHEVDLSEAIDKLDMSMMSIRKILDKEVSFDFTSMVAKMVKMMTNSLEIENLEKFLNDTTQNFDVAIVEWLYSDMYAGFSQVFNCPLIWSSSIEPHWLILSRIHEASNPAFNPNPLSTATPPFSFLERTTNLISQIVFTGLKMFYLGPIETKLYEEYFGPKVARRGRTLVPYEEALFNASFILTNSHTSVGQPISVPPNSKEIGGYHIDSKTKPLPADLQKLMDEAEHGVIYFSMGSNAKSKDFPDVMKKEFLDVLGSFKQTVIWKFEEELPNRPKNVHIVQWAPQQSILAHPNCRVFITHGGLLSTTESVYFGVPTVVMPYGADQHLNAERAVKKGYALKVDLSYEMAGEMKIAVEELLQNPKYAARIKELSKIYHDRLVPPGKELVHWVEHVARTRGAPHLRSPALMMPWYQKMYLDLAAVALIALYAIKFVIKKIYSTVKCMFSKKSAVSKKKTN